MECQGQAILFQTKLFSVIGQMLKRQQEGAQVDHRCTMNDAFAHFLAQVYSMSISFYPDFYL